MQGGSLSQGLSTNISTAPLIRTPGFRTRCHETLNRPSASFLGRTIRTITLSIILGSTVLFVLQSVPSLASWGGWGALDALVAVIFTLEYGAKLLVAPDGRGDEELDHLRRSTPNSACHARIRFMREPMSVIDLLALLPFWLGLFSSGSGFWSQLLRSLRLVRILRMLRLAQESTELLCMVDCVLQALPALRMLAFFLLLELIIVGGLVFVRCSSASPACPARAPPKRFLARAPPPLTGVLCVRDDGSTRSEATGQTRSGRTACGIATSTARKRSSSRFPRPRGGPS